MGEKIEQKIGQIEALEYFFKAILNCLGKNTRSMKNEKLNEE